MPVFTAKDFYLSDVSGNLLRWNWDALSNTTMQLPGFGDLDLNTLVLGSGTLADSSTGPVAPTALISGADLETTLYVISSYAMCGTPGTGGPLILRLAWTDPDGNARTADLVNMPLGATTDFRSDIRSIYSDGATTVTLEAVRTAGTGSHIYRVVSQKYPI